MPKLMTYACPVCGYNRLRKPPENHFICACCGTEFGYEDFADTDERRRERWKSLRVRWLERGAPWFSTVTPKPLGWDPLTQIAMAGLAYRIEVRRELASTLAKSFPNKQFWSSRPAQVLSRA